MKTKMFTMTLVVCFLLFNHTSVKAQDEGPAMPAYITVTTSYWNMDREQSDNADDNKWLEIEKEYLEKVTRKNEYILSASYHMHLYSETNLETKYVQSFASWADIEKAQDRNTELEKLAWPDDAQRKAFLDNLQSFYQHFHSDEIMVPFAGAKLLAAPPSEDVVAYVRVSKMAYPEDGSEEEFMELHQQFVDITHHKNDKIMAYYPNVHGWGADRTDFVEAFYVASMEDVDKVGEGNSEALKAKWPDETERMDFMKKYNRYFTGEHGDAIYTWVKELSK